MRNRYPRNIKKEEARLLRIFLSNDEDQDWDEFRKENASEAYNNFFDAEMKRSEELLAQGIIEN